MQTTKRPEKQPDPQAGQTHSIPRPGRKAPVTQPQAARPAAKRTTAKRRKSAPSRPLPKGLPELAQAIPVIDGGGWSARITRYYWLDSTELADLRLDPDFAPTNENGEVSHLVKLDNGSYVKLVEVGRYQADRNDPMLRIVAVSQSIAPVQPPEEPPGKRLAAKKKQIEALQNEVDEIIKRKGGI